MKTQLTIALSLLAGIGVGAGAVISARATGRSSDNTRGRTFRAFSKRFFAVPPSSIRTVKIRFVTASKSCVTVTAFFSGLRRTISLQFDGDDRYHQFLQRCAAVVVGETAAALEY